MPHNLTIAEPPTLVRAGRAVHGIPKVEHYRFDDYWCLHHYHYNLQLVLDGVPHDIAENSVSLIPAGVRMTYTYPRQHCMHDYAIFSLKPSRTPHAYQIITPPSAVPSGLVERLELAVTASHEQAGHTTSLVWEALWQLAQDASPTAYSEHPLVDQACRLIEARLSHQFSVGELAKQLGVSHNHLTRQFQANLQQGVTAYLAARRMARAQQLLHETTLPIKVIARECGLPDPHAFNKAFRRIIGCSPTTFRKGA